MTYKAIQNELMKSVNRTIKIGYDANKYECLKRSKKQIWTLQSNKNFRDKYKKNVWTIIITFGRERPTPLNLLSYNSHFEKACRLTWQNCVVLLLRPQWYLQGPKRL